MAANTIKRPFRFLALRAFSLAEDSGVYFRGEEFDEELDRIPLDGARRKYNFISEPIQRICPVKISYFHVQARGCGVYVEGLDFEPRVPLLITDDPLIKLIYAGAVEFKEDLEGGEPFIRPGNDPDYLVRSRDWFGMLRDRGNQTGELLAFGRTQIAGGAFGETRFVDRDHGSLILRRSDNGPR